MPQKVPWRHRAAVPNQVWESERSLVGLSPSAVKPRIPRQGMSH